MGTSVTYIGGPEDGRRIMHCCGKSMAGRVVVTDNEGSETVYRLERLPEAGGMRNVYIVDSAPAGGVIEYLLLAYHAKANLGTKDPGT